MTNLIFSNKIYRFKVPLSKYQIICYTEQENYTKGHKSNFPINISLSCVSPNKTRSIQILHEDGVIAYELVGNKSLLKFYKWGDFAGNDSRGETTSVVLMESKTEPLINAIAEYARLSEENKCHDSLNSTVYELELIESIYNFIN